MSAPAYQTGATATGTSSLSITIPSGVTVGHWAFLGVCLPGGTAIPSTPSGWTLLGSAGTGSNPKLAVYQRQIQSGDASSSVTIIASGGDSQPKHALMVVFDGDGSASVQDAISNPSLAQNVTWTATTMAVDQKTLRFAHAYNSSAQPVLTWNNSGSLADTSRQSAVLSAGGTVMTSGVADSAASTGGTEASETVSWIQSSLSAGVSLILGPVNVTVTGVVATVSIAAPAGTATSGTAASVTGVVATVSIAAPAGTSAGGTGVIVTGPVATIAVAAPVGSVPLLLTSWAADESQQFQIPVTLDAVLEFEPAASTPPSTHQALDRHSITMPTPVLDANGIPDTTFVPSDAVSVWGRPLINIEGVDHTFLRGVPARVKSWGSAEPGGDTVCVIDFPQVTPFEQLGVGDLAHLTDGSRVYLNLLRPDTTRLRLFTGEIISPECAEDEQSAGVSIHVQGILFTADNSVTPPSFSAEERDIGTVIAETLNGYQSRKYAHCPNVVTNIGTRSRGAWTPRMSGHITDLLGTATTGSGASQWTLTNIGLVPHLGLKDRTTVHATVTVGTPGLSFDLASDRTGAPNVIFGEGTAPDGGHWRNTKYPSLRADDAPLYPLGGGTFSPGGADTGFTPFATEMRDNGYTMLSGDTYAAADEDEVRDAQTRAGITVDGIVGPQTWAAVFQTGSNVGSLDGAWFAPIAANHAVMPRAYNAQGADIGPNPTYDPSVLRVERYENYGEGITKQQAVLSARAELARVSSPGIQGTITLKIDPQEMSRFELRAGMNIKLKAYQGANPLFHIASADIDLDAQTVTLTVDTHARDLLTLAAIRARNADAASDPIRRNLSQRRSSRQVRDNTVIFDSESGAGIVPRLALFHGLWTVLRIPSGQIGSIARAVFTTDTPASHFAVGVFGKAVTANDLAHLVGNPLTGSKPWDPQADALYTAGLVQAWGSVDEPAGYYPSSFGDGGSVTGRMEDDTAWSYESQHPPWLWVALYSSSSCYISGRLYAAPDGG